MQDFGGKNNPCAIDPDTKEYYCNADTNLVCSGSLDFWLSTQTTRDKIMSDKKTMLEKGPKCVDPAEIPMGKEGQPCRKVASGSKQCDQEGLVCVNVYGDRRPGLSAAYSDYFFNKYKDNKDSSLAMWAIGKYFRIKTNPADNSLIGTFETYGVCIPNAFTKVGSCGDKGEVPCTNELGQKYCFGDNRIVLFAPQAQDSARCVPKITVKTKGLVRCDDGASQTCNEFCAKQGGKCVDTCEDKILVDQGNEVGAKEMMVKAGMFEVQVYDLKIHPKVSGSCNQDYSPSFGRGLNFRKYVDIMLNLFLVAVVM